MFASYKNILRLQRRGIPEEGTKGKKAIKANQTENSFVYSQIEGDKQNIQFNNTNKLIFIYFDTNIIFFF